MKSGLLGAIIVHAILICSPDVAAQASPPLFSQPNEGPEQVDPAAVARVIEAQKHLNEFIRKALEADLEFDRLRDVSVEENAAAQKLLDQHPALKDLNSKKKESMEQFAQATRSKNSQAAKQAEIELAKLNSAMQTLVAGIPEISAQLQRARAARAAFREYRDKLVAGNQEGTRLQNEVDAAKAALVPTKP